MKRTLDLAREVRSEITRHAREAWPAECCGILVGKETTERRARVDRAVPAENVSASPATSFEVSPPRILSAQRSARAGELEIVGYYHSHPGGSARPSDRDRRDAWTETSYVILGLEGREVTSIRSWRLQGGEFLEEEITTGSDQA
ncbi:MAG: Mov34/MPN/PAD-1 family protein [Thermoanaerobaculia bacterium]